jgi:hypothetical protein
MKKLLALLIGLTVCASAIFIPPVMAVSTSHWTHGNESDFKAGTLHNVVVTNLGDVKLSRAIQTIEEQDPDVTSVNALAQAPDGTVYAGTGPKGKLLAIKSDKVTTVTTLDATVDILSLAFDGNGALLIGTGGEAGRIYRVDHAGDKPKQIFAADGVQYIWALQQTPDGNLYAATGPNGQVFEIKADGTNSEIYKNDENNITSMVSDGKDLLYLGTDPNALVIRLNRKSKESFILYNAAESDISALVLDKDGNLYAATGEAGQKSPPSQENGDKSKNGRPEQDLGNTPIPAVPAPAPPAPPVMPNPNPGEPKPIPKQIGFAPASDLPLMLDILPAKPADDPNTPGGAGTPNGAPDAPAGPDGAPGSGPPGGVMPADNGDAAQGNGNAIYKIDKDGFVTEVFRDQVVIYSMVEQNGVLLVGTGSDGNIYQVNPAAEETVVLAKVDAKQVTCLLPLQDGRVLTGLANTGGISAMTSGYATDGTYISPVLDATQVSRFGKIQLHGQLPDGTSLKVSTRSGNVKDSNSPGWSKWSDDADATEFMPIAAPSARFLQYRLTFATQKASESAVVDHVDVAYQIPNMAPVIKAIKVVENPGGDNGSGNGPGGPQQPQIQTHGPDSGGGGPKPEKGVMTIVWDAADPNNDNLLYSLYFRTEPRGPWILMKDKLKETNYDWDTKTVADGRYQVKVVASDAPSNPPGTEKTASRVSEYLVVDNTPPTIGDLDAKVTASSAKIDLRAQDATSIVAGVEYTVDSSDDWQLVLPSNKIYDSPDETVSFTIDKLTPGQHQVTVRATDSHGNQALKTVVVKVGDATAKND